MTANIRRLVFDISGPMSFSVLFIFAVLAFGDVLWMQTLRNDRSLEILPGLLASGAAIFGMPKVAIWRTLPVSRRDIDIARWWQTVAAPQIMLLILLIAPAIGMDLIGQSHKPWIEIQFLAVAQCLAYVVATGFFLIVLGPARVLRRSMMILVLPLIFSIASIYRSGFPLTIAASGYGIAPMILCILTISAALYLWAGNWPLPPTGPILGNPFRPATAISVLQICSRPAHRRIQGRGWGRAIWPLLFGRNEWSILAFDSGIGCLVLLLLGRWIPLQAPIVVMAWAAVGFGTLGPITNAANAIRALRGLPLGTRQLIVSIMAFLLVVEGALFATAETVSFLAGLGIVPPLLLLLPLSLSTVLFPLFLRFGLGRDGLRAAVFSITGCVIGLILWKPLLLSLGLPIIVCGALIVIASAVAWTHGEITKGRRAYRAQPVTPLRWRGEF